jgi:hypothetical protein
MSAEKWRRISALARRSPRKLAARGNGFEKSILPQVVSSQKDDMISVQRLHAEK